MNATGRHLFLDLGLILVLALAGCGAKADVAEPPEIRYGQDSCDQCKMIISEEKYAAAYWTAGGEARRFDDLGGMLRFHQERAEDVASFWVHDFLTGDWLKADEATLVLNAGLETPMGFGLVAFADPEQAAALAFGEAGARVLSFADMMAELDAGTLSLDPMSRHDDHQ